MLGGPWPLPARLPSAVGDAILFLKHGADKNTSAATSPASATLGHTTTGLTGGADHATASDIAGPTAT